MTKYKLHTLSLCLMMVSATTFSDDLDLTIGEGMTKYQHFVTYPFIDKAMRYEKSCNYEQAFSELEKALKKAPNNNKLLEYGIELSLKMNDYQRIMPWLEKLPQAQQNTLRARLQLIQLNKPKLLTYFELQQLLKGLSIHDKELGYQTLFYANLHHYGPKKTLAWSQAIPFELKVQFAAEPEAQLAFSQKDYVSTVDTLTHLAQLDKLSADNRYMLAVSYLQLGRVKSALRLADNEPNSTVSHRILIEYAFHLLGQKKFAQAKAIFKDLEQKKGLSKEALIAYQDLKGLSTYQMAQKADLEYTSCTQEVAEALPNKLQARTLLVGCNPATNTQQWLNLAEASNATKLLKNNYFVNHRLEEKRIDILFNYYVKTYNWKEITLLGKKLTDPAQLSMLAKSYSKLKQYKKAADIWLKLYYAKGQINSLKSALYALSEANDHGAISQLLSKLLANNNSGLRYSVITDKFLNDAYMANEVYSFSQIMQLNQYVLKNKQIKSDFWVNAKQCKQLSNISLDTTFAIMASAQCKAENNKLEAIAMVEAVKSKGMIENQQLASWYADVNNNKKSIAYWKLVPIAQLNSYQFHQYISSLLALDLLPQAQHLWGERSVNSSSWQRIDGSKIFLRLGNTAEAERLLTQAHDPFQNKNEAIALFHVYQQTQQTQKLVAVYDRIQARYGDNNQLMQDYAFYLSRHQPQQAENIFKYLLTQSDYKPDVFVLTAYGDVLAKLEKNKQAKIRYQQAINLLSVSNKPLTDTETKLRHYLQDSHRNVYQGWAFSIAGFVGENASSGSSLIAGQTGDYYQQLEAKYYFNETQWRLPRSALYINYGYSTNFSDAVSVGEIKQNYGKGFNDAYEIGLEWQPLSDYTVYIRGGLKAQKSKDDYKVNPFLTIRGDLLANDAWSKAWKYDRQQWWFQQLYTEAVVNLENTNDVSLFGRYDLGRVFKLADHYKQRLMPYGFLQYSYAADERDTYSTEITNTRSTDQNVRYGLGLLWLSEWMSDEYDGYNLISELGVEWQHVEQSNTAKEGDNAFLLRYALYY